MTLRILAGTVKVTGRQGDGTVYVSFDVAGADMVKLATLSTGEVSTSVDNLQGAVQRTLQAFIKAQHPTVADAVLIQAAIDAMSQAELDRWSL